MVVWRRIGILITVNDARTLFDLSNNQRIRGTGAEKSYLSFADREVWFESTPVLRNSRLMVGHVVTLFDLSVPQVLAQNRVT